MKGRLKRARVGGKRGWRGKRGTLCASHKKKKRVGFALLHLDANGTRKPGQRHVADSLLAASWPVYRSFPVAEEKKKRKENGLNHMSLSSVIKGLQSTETSRGRARLRPVQTREGSLRQKKPNWLKAVGCRTLARPSFRPLSTFGRRRRGGRKSGISGLTSSTSPRKREGTERSLGGLAT